MRTKLDIYSSEKLKDFFSNIVYNHDLNLTNINRLEDFHNSENLSVVFLDGTINVKENILERISKNENFIFVLDAQTTLEKFPIIKNKTLYAPLSVSRFLDMINNLRSTKTYTHKNIDLRNNIGTNRESYEKIYFTEAENLILLNLFHDKEINKKLLERNALKIKEDLNTSSIESHLNRIRKKLIKIKSNFTISSKDKIVCLEIINPDK